MEAQTQAQALQSEKLDVISEPSSTLHSMHLSSSSSTPNPNPPVAINPNGAAAAASPPKPSILKRVWGKLGINALVVMFMVKGGLSPTIAIAIYQRYSVAANYLNLGYVMIVVSILTVPVLPRGKYLLNFFITLILTCVGAAMVFFGQWLGVKARIATTPSGASPAVANGYNSSAAVINAIFLIINVFGINTLRAARPMFSIPAIQYTILITIGFVYGPQEPTEQHSIRFTKELFYSFLTGQAISTAVSLLIIPVSSRKVFFGEATGILQSARGLLKAQLAFVEALEYSDLGAPYPSSKFEDDAEVRKNDEGRAQKMLLYHQKAATLKAASAGILGLSGKLRDDVVFARREVAYGSLNSSDIHEIYRLLTDLMLPISSLSTVVDIVERLKNRYRTDRKRFEEAQGREGRSDESLANEGAEEENEWRELIRELHTSFEPIVQVIDEGVRHILILLGFAPKPKKPASSKTGPQRDAIFQDVERGPKNTVQGDIGFGDYLDGEIQEFRKQRTERLQTWAKERGLDSVFHAPVSTRHAQLNSQPDRDGYKSLKMLHEARASQRLHLILYMEYLLYSVAKATLGLVRFAESKVNDGTMRRSRFIFPPSRVVYKLVRSLVNGEDSRPDIDKVDNMAGNVEIVHLGDSLQTPRDLEHLPPKNYRQAFEDRLRVIPKILGSEPAKFGLRVTVAVMSIAIMNFLHQTHHFFIQQRIVWALVMIAIGMNPSSGSAVFQLLGNLTSSLIGMIFAFVNWYIVDQKTGGIIVFFWLFMMLYFYFAAKFPRFLVAIVAGAITHVLVIGYELQVRVIGIQQATSTGQEYYPLYELAPYRLFTVAGGVLVAYIWTIFPVPITEGSVLRRDLGSSLFLLANYVSSTTFTVEQRVRGTEGDMSIATSPGRKLQKIRQKSLAKQLALLNSMRQNLTFMSWEPSFGGDFPKETYQLIIDEIQSVVDYLTVITYASEAFTAARNNASSSQWLSEFAESRFESNRKSYELVTLLSLLSASLKNKQPLPPYIKAPAYFNLFEQAVGSDPNILGLENINEPGFRAFAIVEISHLCMVDSATSIVELVRGLVGEVDFSYQVAV